MFKLFNQRLEAAQIQGFNWSKDTYTVTEQDGSESYIVLHFDNDAYVALLQRYKELPSGGGGGMGGEPPFEIDTHITEINTDAIDADYMNSRFDKFFKLWQQGEYDQAAMDLAMKDLHKSFAMLSQIEQRYANLFIGYIQSGEVIFDPTMTFRDYIAKYMRKAEDARIARIVRRLGCYEDLLRKLIDRKVNDSNYKEFGYFDELVLSVDKSKAERFFIAVEKEKYKPFRLQMLITKYLKNFVISGGIDSYADIIDGGRKASKASEQDVGQETNRHQSGDTFDFEDVSEPDEKSCDEVVTRTTVGAKQLSNWYSTSKAVACMMDTGCFAYIEDKICLDEPKYVERQESGKMRLTQYAKDHEGFSVDIIETSSDDCQTKLTTAANAGDYSTLPDIVLMQDNSYQKYLKSYPDAFTDLKDININWDDFGKLKQSYSMVDDTHYGVPFDNGAVIACYRTDILDEAGYTIDDLTDITWSKFMEIGKDVHEKTGKKSGGGTGGIQQVFQAGPGCKASAHDLFQHGIWIYDAGSRAHTDDSICAVFMRSLVGGENVSCQACVKNTFCRIIKKVVPYMINYLRDGDTLH